VDITMGFLRDRFPKPTITVTGRRPISEGQDLEVRTDAAESGDELVELKIVGESYRQAAIAAIAGPKEPEGKSFRVGVTLRHEPENAHDRNAVRAEVMGQLLGDPAPSEVCFTDCQRLRPGARMAR
jgi:hypothetical protein